MYNELPSSLEIAPNVNFLAEVKIEKYYLAVNSNLNIGSLCALLVAHGCVFDLFLLLLVRRNHAQYIPNKGRLTLIAPGQAGGGYSAMYRSPACPGAPTTFNK
eukprot:6191692-Pleurochrysis_carterae.AAC.1